MTDTLDRVIGSMRGRHTRSKSNRKEKPTHAIDRGLPLWNKVDNPYQMSFEQAAKELGFGVKIVLDTLSED